MATPDYPDQTRVIDGNGVTRQWWDDASRTYFTYNAAGVQTSATPYTTAENAAADRRATAALETTNATSLRDKARTALTGNNTFLGIASPTNAQVSAQVKALTRQVNALIKLEVGDLSDTTGT